MLKTLITHVRIVHTNMLKEMFIEQSALTVRRYFMSEKMPKFEIYKDAAGKFRFRLKAPNGEIIASGEAYESKDGCKNGIASIKENAPKAEIVDTTQ